MTDQKPNFSKEELNKIKLRFNKVFTEDEIKEMKEITRKHLVEYNHD